MKISIAKYLSSFMFLLLTSFPVMAEVIHWDLSGSDPIGIGGGIITGGFDFNSAGTGSISNITVRTDSAFADPGFCFPCHDFSNAVGLINFPLFDDPNDPHPMNVLFDDQLPNGNDFKFFIPNFEVAQPGAFSNLTAMPQGLFILHDDPNGIPNIFVSDSCNCLTAIGTVISEPVPEPETWAMLMSGLFLTGYMLRRRGKQAINVAT